MVEHENYRKLSKGVLTVYGNSVKIGEQFFPLTREKQIELTRQEIQTTQDSIERMNEEFDKRFEEHVLEYGHDFDKYPVKGFENIEKIDFDFNPEPPLRKKGDIKGFSKASRRRMLQRLNQLNPDDLGFFYHVTLTYPKKYSRLRKIHKKDLDAFIKRCKRRFTDNIEYLWKLEFQKRGAPHYHFLICLPKQYKIQYLRKWFSLSWYEVAQRNWNIKDEKHLRAGVGCDRVTSFRKSIAYLSKYLTKDEGNNPEENQGRYWGCSRNWGEIVLKRAELTGEQLIQFRRLVKRFLKGNKRMQKLSTKPVNLIVFGHWSFFTMAIDWVKQVH